MNESIVVSLSTDGDTVTISTNPSRGGLLLDKGGLLSMLEMFIGKRDVFFRREQHEPAKTDNLFLDWTYEMARHFGLRLGLPDSAECPECGRLVSEPGLCAQCADEKAVFSQ